MPTKDNTVKRGTSDASLQPSQTFTDIEEWYEVETSRVGADDWYAVSNTTSDTLEGARNSGGRPYWASGFEYRIVRKRLTSEVVA